MAQLPTGGSPLYLGDFAKPLYGITQNLTSAMIDQYERRKKEGDQDRAALLKALSFEAIENASEKASKMLLDEYSAVEDKWTQRYCENGLRLSDQSSQGIGRPPAGTAGRTAVRQRQTWRAGHRTRRTERRHQKEKQELS